MKIPRSTEAAVLTSFGEPMVLQEVQLPDSVEAGALLVEVLACSICGTDIHGWQGELTIPTKLPSILGHEMIGRIIAMGSGADRDSMGRPLALGDRVIWTHATCGSCPGCLTSRDSALCERPIMYGYQNVDEHPYVLGGFTRHSYILPTSGRIRVPDSISNELGSVAACAVRSAVNAVDKAGRTTVDDIILVQGSGPIGLFATAMLAVAPHKKIVVVGAPDNRLETARSMGATNTVSIEHFPTVEARRNAVLDATDGRAPTIVLEMSGGRTAFAEGLELAARGATYVLMGQVSAWETPVVPARITMRNLTIKGAFSGSPGYYNAGLAFLDRYQKDFPFDEMISGRYALDDINQALTNMKNMTESKPVLLLE